MRVCVTVPVYHDIKGIKRLLESTTYFEKVFVIDGKYPHFGTESNLPVYSNDGTREICKEFDNVELIDCPMPEPYKRNIGYEIASENKFDFVFTLDSDEYITEFDIRKFNDELNLKKSENHHFYGIREKYKNGEFWYPKLKYRPQDIEMYSMHTLYRINKKLLIHHPQPTININGIKIVHDDSIRDDIYDDWSNQYWGFLREYEAKIFRQIRKNLKVYDTVPEPT